LCVVVWCGGFVVVVGWVCGGVGVGVGCGD